MSSKDVGSKTSFYRCVRLNLFLWELEGAWARAVPIDGQ